MILKSFDGTKIWYRLKRNNNLYLVFVHGWANNWTTWKKEIKFFERKGYSTLTLDLRGHGQSDKPENKKKYSLKCFVKDIHSIIEKENIRNFVLVGHSMGGIISLMYYKLYHKEKNVLGLILCDTTYKNVLEHKKIKMMSPFVKLVLDFLIKNESINQKHFSHLKDIDLSKYKQSSDYFIFLEGLYNTPMKSVFVCLKSMLNFNLKEVLSKIRIPVLIIEGEEDKLLPILDSVEMYQEIKEVDIDFVPKGKHFVNLQNSNLVDRFILNFLLKHKLNSDQKNKT